MVNFAQAPAVSTSCVTLGRAPFTLWTSGPSSVLSTTVSPSEAGTTNGSPTLKWMVRLAKQNMVFMRHICFTLIYQWGHNGWQLKRQNGLMCIRCNSVVPTFSNPGPNWKIVQAQCSNVFFHIFIFFHTKVLLFCKWWWPTCNTFAAHMLGITHLNQRGGCKEDFLFFPKGN